MSMHKIRSDQSIKSLKPGCAKRVSDGRGLYLLPFFNDGKTHHWRYDYSIGGKRKTLSLGVYPDTSLAMARETAQAYRTMVAAGQDPSQQRKEARASVVQALDAERRIKAGEPALDTFEEIGRRWFAVQSGKWCDSYSTKVIRRLEMHAFPHLGHLPIAQIDAPMVLQVCRRVETNGTLETAGRVLELCSSVCRFAVCEGKLKSDPTRDIQGALKKPATKNFAAIVDPKPLAELLRRIDDYSGTATVRWALQLLPMLMVRPSELRLARWEEFDLENGTWLVPSLRMKRTKDKKETGKPHEVPLSRQAVAILEELFALNAHSGVVFPAEGRKGRFMSENTINAALRAMGYSTKTDVTAHGFRATARTLLVERLGFPEAVAEAQLAHAVKDANGTAYNRTEFLEQRRKMLQAWADYLDSIKSGRNTQAMKSAPVFVPVTRRLQTHQMTRVAAGAA